MGHRKNVPAMKLGLMQSTGLTSGTPAAGHPSSGCRARTAVAGYRCGPYTDLARKIGDFGDFVGKAGVTVLN